MSEPEAAQARLLTKGYRAWFLVAMTAVASFNFADRAVFNAMGQAIKQDLALTDTQLGLLGGLSFALLYSLAGVPIGRLTERGPRLRIIAVAITLWSAMTIACGLAANFVQMMLARVGVGIGEAGFNPPSQSLASDHFTADKRASALAVISLGSPIGQLLGGVVGGWIAAQWDWRAAFWAMGAPGVLLGLVVFLTLREPRRGLAEGIEPPAATPRLGEVARTMFAKPSFKHVILGGSLTGFGLNAIGNFLAPFLGRVHHLNVREAAAWMGTISAASLAVGLLAGGALADRLGRRDGRWSAWAPAIGVSLAVPLYLVGFRSPSLPMALGFIFAGNMALITHFGPTLGMIQNLAPPRMRGTASAIYGLGSALIGVGLGPTVLGILSDLFARRAFGAGDFIAACPGGAAPAGSPLADACAAASATGMQNAFSVVVFVFLWAALHFVLAARTLRRDRYAAA